MVSSWTTLQHGNIFKLRLAGQQMTYLLEPESIKLFFTAPDNQIAFRQVTQRVMSGTST